jgi:hypothetical protein
MRLDLRGAWGNLRASYQTAATFGRWTLEGDAPGPCELASTVSERVDAFLGLPLTVAIPVGGTMWLFDVAYHNIDDATAALTLTTRGMPRISPLTQEQTHGA